MRLADGGHCGCTGARRPRHARVRAGQSPWAGRLCPKHSVTGTQTCPSVYTVSVPEAAWQQSQRASCREWLGTRRNKNLRPKATEMASARNRLPDGADGGLGTLKPLLETRPETENKTRSRRAAPRGNSERQKPRGPKWEPQSSEEVERPGRKPALKGGSHGEATELQAESGNLV